MKQEEFMETAELLSDAGASKDVIIRSLIQQGADPETAKKLAKKVTSNKQRKRVLPFVLATVAVFALMYFIFDGMFGTPWLGVAISLFIVPVMVRLFFRGTAKKNNRNRDLDKAIYDTRSRFSHKR